jgi:NAD(P)-dependent dehydrogenase (short-subunit alcohol dehydrogenase family)
MCHYFIKATGGKGTIINLVSLGASFLFPGMSSYATSKLAAIKLGEFLDLGNSPRPCPIYLTQLTRPEHPELRVFSVHPGMVEAEEGRGMVVPPLTPFAKDKALLFGGVSLYLQKPEADFLRGGFFSVNWDLDELQTHKGEVTEKALIKMAFLNGKLAPGGYNWAPVEEKKAD